MTLSGPFTITINKENNWGMIEKCIFGVWIFALCYVSSKSVNLKQVACIQYVFAKSQTGAKDDQSM